MFETRFETRHTDTFAATPFVHAGVLLALTEAAYARVEEHLGISKPEHIVAVQRETQCNYRQPLHWRDGAVVSATTLEVDSRGFTQEFVVRSPSTGSTIAQITHRWAWLDTTSGSRVDIPVNVRALLRGL